MKAKKVLFINQEIIPYVSESQMAIAGREIPQAIQESGYEIRTFMPKWGMINERRNQLHEVIRLSGMNIIIDDSDHPLLIKVASIQPARMQVYFIDNDDYFNKRRAKDDENGEEYADNAERAIFYARGVLETVKKLRWAPDVIHCNGWMSVIVPFFLKTAYKDEPIFANTKVVFSAYDEMPENAPMERFAKAIAFHGATAKKITTAGIDLSLPDCWGKIGAAFADGFIQMGSHGELDEFVAGKGIPTITCAPGKEGVPQISDFYQQLFPETEEEA